MLTLRSWSVFTLGKIRRSGERRAAHLVLIASCMAVAVLWATIIGVLVRSKETALHTEELVLQRMTTVVEEQTIHFFSLIRFFTISADQILSRSSGTDPRFDPEFRGLVDSLIRHTHNEIAILLIHKNGDAYNVHGDNRAPVMNAADRDYFTAQFSPATRGMYIGQPVTSRVTGRLILPVSYPIAKNSSGFVMMVLSIPVEIFNSIYEEGRTKPDGSIALVHRSGTVMARAPKGDILVGRSIANGVIWKNHLSRADRGAVVIPATAIDQNARVTAYAAMSRLPLVVIVSNEVDDVLANWYRWLYAGIALGIVSTIVVAWGTRTLVRLLGELGISRAEAEELAWQDPLTGLPNRRMFHQRLNQEMKRVDRDGSGLALMYIDLDGFKDVNDTLGHTTGDELLKECAQRIRACVRETDTIARLGGDEFTVVLNEVASLRSTERIAGSIVQAISEPFHLNGEAIYVSASIGITCYPQDATDYIELMKNADQAMYSAKAEGKRTWRYFTPEMQIAVHKRKALQSELRTAVTENQFELYYQPIVELKTGNIHKAEALVRWKHPSRGIVAPMEFIPALEETGMIVEVGDWVFREAARQVAIWRAEINPDFQISVNKSPVQFKLGTSASLQWHRYLEEVGLPGSSVAVEITEGLLLEPNETVSTILLAFYEAGIQVALDDFGTGFSSLSYLKKFDIDYVKIDRSFVSNLESQYEDGALCEAIIVMAHKLGMQVIAEGIETEGQWKMLVSMGCDYGQGYYFSPPVPAKQFRAVRATGKTPIPAVSI
jgi:diguanylate cyclase (GGDEF)-like protein